MNTEEYKKKYQQQLWLGRRIWLEEYQKPRKGDAANIEQTVQALIKSLEEKEREAQVYHQQLEQKEKEDAEKDEEIRRYHHQLQEKERELQEKDREHQVVLQEKDLLIQQNDEEHQKILQENQEALRQKGRELQEKDRELFQSQETIRRYQQQALTDNHWVINKDEVTLTKEELGRGSYAVVTVGIFRGLRVAVKSLHAIIISNYNRSLFSREMSIASRVRHPKLVQFIGATKVGNPLILTELMSIRVINGCSDNM
uniref:Protein kinase domain-containing protein n=1 Tax=Amphimedon queenslandica TaxID=400682 RepID=A0A1X7SJC1_AMPQE